MRWALAACLAWPFAVAAQTSPDRPPLDDALRLGTVATLAPLCGMRDEAWAFDLRRATIMDSAGTTRTDDPALRAAPGSDHTVATLSFAEAEALESFAQSTPQRTCEPLSRDPDLARADHRVQTFRALRNLPGPGS